MFFTEVSTQTHTVMPAEFFPKSLYSTVIITRCFFTDSGIKDPPCAFPDTKEIFFLKHFFSLPSSHTEVHPYNSLAPET